MYLCSCQFAVSVVKNKPLNRLNLNYIQTHFLICLLLNYCPSSLSFSQGVVLQTSDQRPIQEHQRVQADLTLKEGEEHDGTSEVMKSSKCLR